MGNAATCSQVDVVGTVTVTQKDGKILEFMQPIFASEVKKLHPGNWLVQYVSTRDHTLGKQQGKMSMLQGNEELRTGQVYFLLPIPSHFRKRLFGPNASKQNSSRSSKLGIPATATVDSSSPRQILAPKSQQQKFRLDGSKGRDSRPQAPTPVFSMCGSPLTQHISKPVQCPVLRSTKKSRFSSQKKIHFLDWRPTLMTIQEVL